MESEIKPVVYQPLIFDYDVASRHFCVRLEKGEVVARPKHSCNSCYGRGWSGHDKDTKEMIPCPCLLKQAQKYRREIGEKKEEGKNETL